MAEPEPSGVEIHQREGFVEAFYTGPYSLMRYKNQILESVRACEQKGAALLLVDFRGITDFTASTQERYQLGRYGAEVSRKLDKVAILGRAEQFEPDAFATLVARNRGLKIQPFTDREAAVKWLLKK